MSEEVRNAMTNQGKHPRRSRWAAFGLGTALLLALTGDGVGQGATGLAGIDPLEVLDLKVKPNVGIILDTSGSMAETTLGNGVRSDFNQSKMYLAKTVLNQVITDNQSEVNFLFATYKFPTVPTWNNCPGGNCTGNLLINRDMPGDGGRFQYSTDSWAAVGALPVQGTSPGMAAAGTEAVLNRLYAWQWIQNTPPCGTISCASPRTVSPARPPSPPAFYSATTIGPAIKAALEACGPSTNTYNVTYNAGSGVFTIARATGANSISLLWTDALTTFDGPTRMTANQTGGTSYNTQDARINLLQRVTRRRVHARPRTPTAPAPAPPATSPRTTCMPRSSGTARPSGWTARASPATSFLARPPRPIPPSPCSG